MLKFAIVLLGLLLMMDRTESISGAGPHIADVNILLPPKMTYPVEYRLQGSDGCFKWSWDHHDILSVLPEYNMSSHCSTSARLRSIAPYSGRKETAVYASDMHTGIFIRCKVFIDNISRIQIFHSSVKLDLDGLATLRLRAFDNEDNVFSSLVGLRFMWHLMPQADGLPHHLVHLPLKDSPLSDCAGLCGDLDIQVKLEDSGVFSDVFVVRGIEIGHEIVAVHLLEPEHENVADEIVLTVAEAMSLDPPSPVFVLIGSTFSYKLKVIRGNSPQEVKLPSPHHRWSVSNFTVAQVDPETGLTKSLTLGVTNVLVEDIRVSGHIQISSLNVVLPDSLRLYMMPLSITNDSIEGTEAVLPLTRWFVVSGRQYLIQIKVFSRGPGAREVYITEGDEVELFDNGSGCWKISFVPDDIATKHGWRNCRILQATSRGEGKLTASLAYFSGHYESKEVLKVEQEIVVCDQVKFTLEKMSGTSKSIRLPWVHSVYQEVELKAMGGCAKTANDYKWFSSDVAILSVSASGVVQAKRPGKASVRVVSIFDPSNFDEIVVEVSVPSSMVMLHNFRVETVVGSHLRAAATMKTSNGAFYYSCDAFNSVVKWKVVGGSFIIVNATMELPIVEQQTVGVHGTLDGPPCSWTSIYASGSGQSILEAKFSKEYPHFEQSFQEPMVLKASSRIAAYPQLVAQQAGDGSKFGGYWFNSALAEADNLLGSLENLFLAPGTEFDVMVYGGPERWSEGVDYIQNVEILNENSCKEEAVLVNLVSGGYRSLYRTSCQKQGTFNLRFTRGNLAGDDHPVPAIAEVLMSVICSIPSSIVLLVDEPVNRLDVIQATIQAERDSEKTRVNPVTVANGRTIRIAAVSISDSKEPFANSSSLSVMWELSSCVGLAYWNDPYDSESSKCSWERFLSLENESGLCIVRATVVGFNNATSGNYSTPLLESFKNTLTDAIRLQLVSTLTINPELNLLFFNPDAKLNLSISGGSCFLEVVVNDSRVIEVTQPASGSECSGLMVTPKGLGPALVTIYDVGLTPPISASAAVQVAEIDWIKITSGEEISLVEGSTKTIGLLAGIDDGRTFDSSQFSYMNICVHIEDCIVELVDIEISSTGHSCVRASEFEVKAVEFGITTLYVSVMHLSGREVSSQTVKVEVYSPARIHPRDLFLFPMASYVLTIKGGPRVGVHVEYESSNNTVAVFHKPSGRISAVSPGNATIVASIFGAGDSLICQAYGTVKVGVPSSMKLNLQSEQLGIGRQMSIYPLFPEGDLFSFYELCRSYQWTVEDEKVLSFHKVEQVDGGKYTTSGALKEVELTRYVNGKEVGFINFVYGRSAGRSNVAVTFSCDFMLAGSETQTIFYNASASLLVVPGLPLALGVPITWILPPYYTMRTILPSSVESHGHQDSHSRKETIIYKLLKQSSEKGGHISIDGDRIKTSESNNLACIEAKDVSSGRLEIAACVKVMEVAQIRISDKNFQFHVINLAVGAELDLPISYYDYLGNLFNEAYNAVILDVETNYPDVVTINHTQDDNGSVHLKAKQHGKALIRISINNSPEKSGYVLISVGAFIYPQNPVLLVGGCLNFSIKGLNDLANGTWRSTNGSVISVNTLSGIAEAVGQGTTQVVYEGSSVSLETTVTVGKGYAVSVDAPAEMLTNVLFPAKGYHFSVKFRDEFGGLGSSKGVLYDCEVDPHYLGYARPWLDLHTNNSYCLFYPYSPGHLASSMPKSKDVRPHISITIHAIPRGVNQASGSATALFIGGFSVLESGKLNLTPNSNKTVLTILGNTDVEIHWNEPDLTVVGPIYKDDNGIGGRASYEVRATGKKKFQDKIIITLPVNGQRAEIDVNYEAGETADSGNSFHKTLLASIFVCLVVLIGTMVLFIRFLDRPNRSRRPNIPAVPTSTILATPQAAAPVTPDRSRPSPATQSSPQTPKAFVDYIRQTIDETPYYRGRGRRINPQHTY